MTTVYVIETEVEDYPITLAIYSTREDADKALPIFKEKHSYVAIVERPLDPSDPTVAAKLNKPSISNKLYREYRDNVARALIESQAGMIDAFYR